MSKGSQEEARYSVREWKEPWGCPSSWFLIRACVGPDMSGKSNDFPGDERRTLPKSTGGRHHFNTLQKHRVPSSPPVITTASRSLRLSARVRCAQDVLANRCCCPNCRGVGSVLERMQAVAMGGMDIHLDTSGTQERWANNVQENHEASSRKLILG